MIGEESQGGGGTNLIGRVAGSLHRLRGGWEWVRGRPAPLSVGCILTHRCNLHCAYCSFPDHAGEEMSTQEWKGALTEFAAAGTLRFGFSGGEPLLRSDCGELIRHARSLGAVTTLNTNASLLPARLHDLRGLHILTTSLDGATPEAHDTPRGARGNFEKVLRGIHRAVAAGLSVYTQTVLTRSNLGEVPGILALAERHGFRAGFQPASSCSVASDAVPSLVPEEEAFRATTLFLLQARRQGRPVLNSTPALKALLRWPRVEPSACRAAGRYFISVDPSGRVFPCYFVYQPPGPPYPQGREKGFLAAFQAQAQQPFRCPGCSITPLQEMNHLFSGNPIALWERLWDAGLRG